MIMRKLIAVMAVVLLSASAYAAPKNYSLKSPDGKLPYPWRLEREFPTPCLMKTIFFLTGP